jgi:hypothetical protein
MSAKPAMKFRIGNLTATIWKNNDKFFTTVLSRAYKEDDGEWKQHLYKQTSVRDGKKVRSITEYSAG